MLNFRTHRVLLGACCLAFCCAAQAQQFPSYEVIDLGTLGGAHSTALGISPDGQVTGVADLADGSTSHAFIYRNGGMTGLGVLTGESYSVGLSLNDKGQVTGQSTDGMFGSSIRGFLYSNGAMTDLGTLGGAFATGTGINAAGQVTGWSATSQASGGWDHAFIYSNGSMRDLGSAGPYNSLATAINDASEVTGNYDIGTPHCCQQHAFLYSRGVMADLGTLGGAISEGQAINSAGDVTGEADTASGSYHAFLYHGGRMSDLGALYAGYSYSFGESVNTAGEVTGWSFVQSGSNVAQHAFLYSGGTMKDLNTLIATSPLAPYVTLTDAGGINDNGWIAANGTDSRTGNRHAYLVRPMGKPSATVSPGSLSFGQQLVKTTSAARTLVVSNTGTAALHVAVPGLGGADPGDFLVSNGCTAAVMPGKSCSIGVSFRPSATGNRSATLSIPSDASNGALSVPLGGTGTAPYAKVSPGSISFGDQPVNSTSAVHTLVVSNTGTAALHVAKLSMGGQQPGDFVVQSNGCTAAVLPGKSCNIGVSFSPSYTGQRSAMLSIPSDASNGTLSVPLDGSGTGICLTIGSTTICIGLGWGLGLGL
jgi:probable HAF family extracellular repeat protein